MPAKWKSLQAALDSSPDKEIGRLTRELSVVFGDGRAIADVVRRSSRKSADPPARHDAVRVLVEARDKRAVPVLLQLLDDRDIGPDAARGLASFDDPAIPGLLLKQFHKMRETVRDAAIVTLSSRPAWARLLLAAIKAGKIDRDRVPAFQVRQMSTFPGEDLRREVAELWPQLKTMSAAKRIRIDQLKRQLSSQLLAAADRPSGRRQFRKNVCHVPHALWTRRKDRP